MRWYIYAVASLLAVVRIAGAVSLNLSDDRGLPHSVFIRGATLHITCHIPPPSSGVAEHDIAMSLREPEGKILNEWHRQFKLRQGETNHWGVSLDTAEYRSARYLLAVTATISNTVLSNSVVFYIAPVPADPGIMLAMLEETKRGGAALTSNLQHLAELGMSGVMHYQIDGNLIDQAPWYGMRAMGLLHGHPGGFHGKAEDIHRINARGESFVDGIGDKRIARRGIANIAWQDAMAASFVPAVEDLARYNGFLPYICTSDDFYRWTGLDYHPDNVRRFHGMHGIDPPRPTEARAVDYPRVVNGPAGIIPDDDPWVLWQRFNAREALGRYNTGLAKAVIRATGGKGRIGPVSGGGPVCMGTVPLVDLESGQWPPYNFGDNGFNLISYYNYNYYAYPALMQVWWAQVARMGNRELPVWLMPDSMYPREYYHVQNWHLYMAAHLEGLVYFIYEWSKPGFLKAMQTTGHLTRKFGPWMRAIKPAPATVGLLLPFETAAFRADHPIDSGLAFCNLAMAHAEVEPVWPEEIPAIGARYKAILLHDIDRLTVSNTRLLEKYFRRGGKVFVDHDSAIELSWATRLDWSFKTGNRAECYGNTNQILRMAEFVRTEFPPWVDSDDPFLYLRHFQAGRAHYIWLVDLMDHAADHAHIPPPRTNAPTLPAKYEAWDRTATRIATISVPPGGWAAYDVFGKRIIPVRPGDDRATIKVTIPCWQGMLIALYPVIPIRIGIDTPAMARGGECLNIAVAVEDDKAQRITDAVLPLEIEIRDPAGIINREYSAYVATREGSYRHTVNFARNDMVGTWSITIRELTTGITSTKNIELRGSSD